MAHTNVLTHMHHYFVFASQCPLQNMTLEEQDDQT